MPEPDNWLPSSDNWLTESDNCLPESDNCAGNTVVCKKYSSRYHMSLMHASTKYEYEQNLPHM